MQQSAVLVALGTVSGPQSPNEATLLRDHFQRTSPASQSARFTEPVQSLMAHALAVTCPAEC